jgi:acetylornithine/N-succinyldiaminopimelate aminotransferase
LDEVQTGIGRTGTLFAYEQYGVEPDIMSLAKGLGGGVPIGGFMVKNEACVFSPGEHGSTFGGNCLTCAAAFSVVKYVIENNIAGNAKKVGDHLIAGLKELKKKYHCITDVRGRGLLVALEFSSDIGQPVLMACLRNGLLVNQLKPNALRFMPALIINNDDIDKALDILDKALSSIDN